MRGQLRLGQRFAVVLRSCGANCRERNLHPRERHETGRRRPVDDPPQRTRIRRGEQFGRGLCHRPGDFPRHGSDRRGRLAALHPLPQRHDGLYHRPLRSAHHGRGFPQQPHPRPDSDERPQIDRTDGAVGRRSVRKLLVVRRQDSGRGRRTRNAGGLDRGRAAALVAGPRPLRQTLDRHRRTHRRHSGGALPHRRRHAPRRADLYVRRGRPSLVGHPQRHARHALLHQPRRLAHAGRCRGAARHAVPALYADHLLRSGGRSADFGGLRGRRHRLRPARRGLPLHGAGRGRRHDTRRHHPRIVLFQTVQNIRRR